MNCFRSLVNWGFGSGFVKMSASWSFVLMYSTEICYLSTYEWKWWRRIEKCFVLGRDLWLVASFKQLILSSNVLQCILGVILWTGKWFSSNSSNKWITEMTSRSADDNATYSASVVLNAMIDWSLDFQIMGHPAYITMKPDLEYVDVGSDEERCVQLPAQSASTKHSSPRVRFGFSNNPWSFVFNRYLQILFTASSWSLLGSAQNLAHYCTA